MRSLIRSKSVYRTLMGGGMLLLVVSLWAANDVVLPLAQIFISFSIGLASALSVGWIEVFRYRRQKPKRYRPSIIPYTVWWTLLIGDIGLKYLRIHLACVGGIYLIVLAIIFKVYEEVSDNAGTTWNELFEDCSSP